MRSQRRRRHPLFPPAAAVVFGALVATSTTGCAAEPPPPERKATLHVNDRQTDGDRFSARAGSDSEGDGSAERPFASLARALKDAKPGDLILLDTGGYELMAGIDLAIDDLQIRGAGVGRTSLSMDRDDVPALRTTSNGVQIADLAVSGGSIGIELRGNHALVRRVAVHAQGTFGILLRDSVGNVVHDCRLWGTGFRGLQIAGGRGHFISNCWSGGNANAGFCLAETAGNVVTGNIADQNGTSGFFIVGESANNELIGNQSYRSGMGGFYLFNGSHGNVLEGNVANWNQRGFVLKHVMNNRLEANSAEGNHYAEFQVRGESRDNVLASNRGEIELLPGKENP